MMTKIQSERIKTPVVVMGAEHDWLVAPPSELFATARAFNTDPITMPGGHDMMLDVAWEKVALEIDRQIRRFLACPQEHVASGPILGSPVDMGVAHS